MRCRKCVFSCDCCVCSAGGGKVTMDCIFALFDRQSIHGSASVMQSLRYSISISQIVRLPTDVNCAKHHLCRLFQLQHSFKGSSQQLSFQTTLLAVATEYCSLSGRSVAEVTVTLSARVYLGDSIRGAGWLLFIHGIHGTLCFNELNPFRT